MVVVALGYDFLFKFLLAHCELFAYFQNLEKDSIEMTKMASTAKNEANALEAENARLETELKNLEVELRNMKSTLRAKSNSTPQNTTPTDFISPHNSGRLIKKHHGFTRYVSR